MNFIQIISNLLKKKNFLDLVNESSGFMDVGRSGRGDAHRFRATLVPVLTSFVRSDKNILFKQNMNESVH